MTLHFCAAHALVILSWKHGSRKHTQISRFLEMELVYSFFSQLPKVMRSIEKSVLVINKSGILVHWNT